MAQLSRFTLSPVEFKLILRFFSPLLPLLQASNKDLLAGGVMGVFSGSMLESSAEERLRGRACKLCNLYVI